MVLKNFLSPAHKIKSSLSRAALSGRENCARLSDGRTLIGKRVSIIGLARKSNEQGGWEGYLNKVLFANALSNWALRGHFVLRIHHKISVMETLFWCVKGGLGGLRL